MNTLIDQLEDVLASNDPPRQAGRDGVTKERLNQYFASFFWLQPKPPGPHFSFIGCGNRRTEAIAGRREAYFSILL